MKLARRQKEATALKAYKIFLVFFYSVIFIHKLNITVYKKEIEHLFANFLSCNATK